MITFSADDGRGQAKAGAASAAGPDAQLIRLGEKLEQAWARELAIMGEATEEQKKAMEATGFLVERIEKHRAHTLEGLRVKARAAMWSRNGRDDPDEPFSLDDKPGDEATTDVRLACSIIRDLAAGVSETEPDPAVSAFHEWHHIFRTMLRYERGEPDDAVAELLHDREAQSAFRLAETVATTPEGFLLQLRAGLTVFGEMSGRGREYEDLNPDDFDSFGTWTDGRSDKLYRSLLAGAERLLRP